MFIQKPWVDYVKSGLKTVEGRTGPLGRYNGVTHLQIFGGDTPFLVEIVEVRHYDDLFTYIAAEGYRVIAPHTSSNDQALVEYMNITKDNHHIFSQERVKERGGINAIQLRGCSPARSI